MNKITSFKDEYRFLSNFYQSPVTLDGLTYPNAEAAFQAQKCEKEEDKVKPNESANIKGKKARKVCFFLHFASNFCARIS